MRLTKLLSRLILLMALALALGLDAGLAPAAPASLTLQPVWAVEGGQQAAEFGAAANRAGDVNGDGYADVIVGSPKFDLGVDKEGAAFVFHGGATGLETDANWSAGSGVTGAAFGSSANSAGDVNGDGYTEVIVGAPLYNNGDYKVGAAFAYYGSGAGLNPTPDWWVIGNLKDGQYGSAVSGVGDVNGDGYDDVLVGASRYEMGQSGEGAAFLHYGAAGGLSSLFGWFYESDQEGAEFGSAVAAAGDLNGDGYADVAVGAPHYDNGEADEGAVFIFYGAPGGLSPLAGLVLEGNKAGASFGHSISSAGDVNGDGYDELVVGAPQYENGQAGEGMAFVYFGSASGLIPTPTWRTESNRLNALYGWSVSGAGDVNGDGYADVAVGAHLFETDQPDEGAVFLFLGTPNGLTSWPVWEAEGDKIEAYFGYAVGGAGDVNQDGCDDLVVGSPGYKRDERIIMGRALAYRGLPESEDPRFRVHLPMITNQQ